MKYTQEERLEIGKRIYTGEIDKYAAAREYGISEHTARDYMRLYRHENGLPDRRVGRKQNSDSSGVRTVETPPTMEEYASMTKEELILELMRSRIREARLKKGYEVKGDGTVILYDNENTK